MINFLELYKNGKWTEPFLIISISLFIATSFILYFLIIRSRSKNIKKELKRIGYAILIEKLLSSIIFQDITFADVKDNHEMMPLNSTFFRAVLTESIIDLHKNYEGNYAQKLEQFYNDSGLINDSFKKLKSLKWEVKCKGITELAEMNITGAFDIIIKISKARNKTLKITSINACIKLAGTKSITYLTEHPFPIDDWMQINIINAFKKHDLGDTKGVELLLESQNTTVISLGLKLIKELKLTQKIPYVEQLTFKAPNTLIMFEAQNVLRSLMF
ncbi:hypothetical protein ACEN2I_04135 [Flavobacterium sp. W22_SRS_FK3]|uniref:hypothetical protein n=1 Tax=Flavobacterium sp. W22_SRS_FK3 TaxID=3240275 RepID=UPI003F8E246C